MGSSLYKLSDSLKILNHKFESGDIKEKNWKLRDIMVNNGEMVIYDYISDDNQLMQSKLPAKEHFYSELKGENL